MGEQGPGRPSDIIIQFPQPEAKPQSEGSGKKPRRKRKGNVTDLRSRALALQEMRQLADYPGMDENQLLREIVDQISNDKPDLGRKGFLKILKFIHEVKRELRK